MKKGHTVNDAIKQAKKLNDAHLQFNTIIMYGVAGAGESIDNAKQTAKVINSFETKKVTTMSLMVFNGIELENMINRDEFVEATRTERLEEIKTLLENLDPKKK